MRAIRALTLSGACLIPLLLCSCTTGPTPREIRDMGPVQVVYLQEPGDIVALDSPYSGNAVFGCVFMFGLVAGLVCDTVEYTMDKYRRLAVSAEQAKLTAYADVIKTLGFNDQAYAMFTSAVGDTPWLAGKQVARVPWSQDGTTYAHHVAGDTVVYVQPVFAMAKGSNQFLVYFFVAIQKYDPSYPKSIYDYRNQEFAFTHLPLRMPPGLGRRERDALENAASAMDPDKAIQIWFTDDGALLREDFAQDLKQVDQDIRKLLSSRPAAAAQP